MPSEQPLVSFVLLAYNQEKYIREAVEGACSQTYLPLEIILSDDCSKDRTFEIMQEMVATYQGPHKIILNRNPKNLGLGHHYNRVMELASGEIVELAAGDDISLPYRTTKSVEIFLQHPKLVAVSLGLCTFSENSKMPTPSICMDAPLQLLDSSRFMWDPKVHVNAPARAFKKYAFDFFGPICEDCPVEDGANLFRCVLLGPVGYSHTVAVLYRRHNDNVTSSKNAYKISFALIYKDFRHALEKALEKGLVSKDQHFKIRAQLEKKQVRGDAMHYFKCQKIKALLPLLRISLSKEFNMQEKVEVLKDVLREDDMVRRVLSALRSLLGLQSKKPKDVY